MSVVPTLAPVKRENEEVKHDCYLQPFLLLLWTRLEVTVMTVTSKFVPSYWRQTLEVIVMTFVSNRFHLVTVDNVGSNSHDLLARFLLLLVTRENEEVIVMTVISNRFLLLQQETRK